MPTVGYDITTFTHQFRFWWERRNWGSCMSQTLPSSDSDCNSGYFRTQRPASVSTKPWPRDGWRPPTSYYRKVEHQHYPAITANTIRGRPPSLCFGVNYPVTERLFFQGNVLTPTPIQEDPVDSVLYNAAVIKVLNLLKSEGEANLGLALLERKQTERLLTDTVMTISRSVRNVYRQLDPRNKRKFNAAKVLDAATRRNTGRGISNLEAWGGEIPSKWLEYQYGWKPLMSDVTNAMSSVDYAQSNDLYRFSKKAYVKRNVVKSISMPVNVPLGNIQWRWDYEVYRSCFIRLDYTVNTGYMASLASLGLLNPVSLVWEKLPFSFVVDWFLPLGSWFNTFDATAGKSFKGGSASFVAITPPTYGRVTHTSIPALFEAGSLRYDGSPGMIRSFAMQRNPLITFPSPSPPAWKNPFSPHHVANALSLLATAFGRGVPRGIRR